MTFDWRTEIRTNDHFLVIIAKKIPENDLNSSKISATSYFHIIWIIVNSLSNIVHFLVFSTFRKVIFLFNFTFSLGNYRFSQNIVNYINTQGNQSFRTFGLLSMPTHLLFNNTEREREKRWDWKSLFLRNHLAELSVRISAHVSVKHRINCHVIIKLPWHNFSPKKPLFRANTKYFFLSKLM